MGACGSLHVPDHNPLDLHAANEARLGLARVPGNDTTPGVRKNVLGGVGARGVSSFPLPLPLLLLFPLPLVFHVKATSSV